MNTGGQFRKKPADERAKLANCQYCQADIRYESRDVWLDSTNGEGCTDNFGTERTHCPAPHSCGMCDAPLIFDGREDDYDVWYCGRCNWKHIAKDCCEEGFAAMPADTSGGDGNGSGT